MNKGDENNDMAALWRRVKRLERIAAALKAKLAGRTYVEIRSAGDRMRKELAS